MFAGTALSVHLFVCAGLSLFIICGPYLSVVVCVFYAYNLTQFCLCESYSPVETTDLRVIKGVRTLIQTLNDKLKVTGDLCIRYEEFSVNASRIRSSGDMLQITVNLHPYPFPANFLAFVQLTRTGMEVSGFERLDIYKEMSVCLDKMDEKDLLESKFLAMSCVCKDILRRQ